MAEPDLVLHEPTDDFAWPHGAMLTGANGQQRKLLPHKKSPPKIDNRDHAMAGDRYVYATDDQVVLTEREVAVWLRGHDFSKDAFDIVGGSFDICNEERLKSDYLIRELCIRGFDDVEARLHLKWMVESGQLAIERNENGQYLRQVW